MSGNSTPWLILAAVTLAALVFKGYIKLPMLGVTPKAPGSLADLTRHQLGVLFAQATKREAEEELASLFAKTAADQLKASFTAPFSPAAPDAQPATDPSGVNPTT